MNWAREGIRRFRKSTTPRDRRALGALALLSLFLVLGGLLLTYGLPSFSGSQTKKASTPQPSSVVTGSNQEAWISYSPPEGDFRIDFPGQPQKVETPVTLQLGEKTTTRTYAYNGKKSTLEITVQTLAPGYVFDVAMWEQNMGQLGTIKGRSDRPFRNTSLREIAIEGKNGVTYTVRFIPLGSKGYTLMETSSTGLTSNWPRFVDSFNPS